MKLRNFMYATMIACAFASCSNDDVIENGPDAKGDASLTIGLGVKSTKADIAAGTETAVNDINIFLLEQETNVTIQQGEILLHYDMIAVKSHVERQRWCFQTAEILEWPSALGEDRWYSISAKGL